MPGDENDAMRPLSFYSLEARRHAREIKEKRKRTLEELREHQRRLQDMEPEEDEPEIEEESGDSVISSDCLATRILENMTQNLVRDRRGWRYTEDVVDFAYVLSRCSMRAYNMLRLVLPLPSRQTLSAKYGKLEKDLMKMYENDGLCHALLDRYFERSPLSNEYEELQCTLAIDAFTINVFNAHVKELRAVGNSLGAEVRQQVNEVLDRVDESLAESDVETETMPFRPFNNCFLVMLVPFRWDRPTLTLSLFPETSGCVNKSILRRLFRIIDICKDYNIRIRTISSDGDPGYNCLHSTLSSKWLCWRNGDFHQVLEAFQGIRNASCDLEDGGPPERLTAIPIADPLHAIKIARSRALEKRVFLSPVSLISVSLDDFEVFHNETWFHDRRHIARMSDYHALEMFSPRVLRELITLERYPAAIYCWGWAALMMAIRIPFLSIETRQSLLISCFYMFRMFLDQQVAKQFKGKRIHQRFKSGCLGVTFFETKYLVRVIHLVFAIYIELSTNGKMVRLSAFGTHQNENAIGRARVAANGTNNYNVFQCHFAKSEICRHLQHALGICQPIRTRENIGGAKLDLYDTDLIAELDLGNATVHLLDGFNTGDKDKQSRSGEIPKVYPPNRAANAAIIARLLSFEGKQQEAAKEEALEGREQELPS